MGSYLGNPDVSFETAAKAFDVNGATVTRPGEIAPALARGIKELKDGRPFVIDVVAERVGLLADFDLVPEILDRRTADETGLGGMILGRSSLPANGPARSARSDDRLREAIQGGLR